MLTLNAVIVSVFLASIPTVTPSLPRGNQETMDMSGIELENRIILPNRVARTEKLKTFGITIIKPCGEYFLQVRVPDLPFEMISYVSGYQKAGQFMGARAAVSASRVFVIIDNKQDTPRAIIIFRGKKDDPPDNILKMSQKDFDAAKACLPAPAVPPP